MELCNINDIRALLGEHGFKFSKSMGQNFLMAKWVPERIAEECGCGPDTCVLEIGPGIGCLTEQLSMRSGKVVAVELDRRLEPVLKITLRDRKNVEIVFDDIMKIQIDRFVENRFGGLSPIVCANLPYNITSPVLTKLLEAECFDSITVMIQKEVAKRICAGPGQEDYGAFSLFVQYYGEPELLFDVPNTCFEPRPKVTSSVVRITKRNERPVECDREILFKVIRAAFNQRRKTLLNALYAAFTDLTKEELESIILNSGIDPTVRGERLSLSDFAAVGNNIVLLMSK